MSSLHNLSLESSLYEFLIEIDRELAEKVQRSGCAHCLGRLHHGDYPRKPRGLPTTELDDAYSQRFSFCCGRDGCRRRATPPSVRFAGRKVYVAAVWILACTAMGTRVSRRQCDAWRQQAQVSFRTIVRWLNWWRSQFVETTLWRQKGHFFMPPVDMSLVPASLFERFNDASSLQSMLRFVAPMSTQSVQVA